MKGLKVVLRPHMILCLMVVHGFSACDDSASSGELEDLVVVEAYLYAGEPIDDIRLTTAVSLNDEGSEALPISDADVRLIKNGTTFTLVPSDSEGMYHYEGSDLAVEAGDVFQIEVAYEGTIATGETIVPASPLRVALTDDAFTVPTIGQPGQGGFGGGRPQGGGLQDASIAVTWENSSENLHFVVIEDRIAGEPDYILPEFIRDRFSGFRLVNEPTRNDFQDINLRSLEVVGPHAAIVYRVNQEYADLYDNREQDSRDLNEPPSNIRGGLGVFSAFHGAQVIFDVVREE